MKKFMMAMVCLMTMVLFSSCGSTYIVTADYDVCYPDGTKSYVKSMTLDNVYSANVAVKAYSIGGTNYISVFKTDNPMTKEKGSYNIESTTAPMRLNSYDAEKVTKKQAKRMAMREPIRDYVY